MRSSKNFTWSILEYFVPYKTVWLLFWLLGFMKYLIWELWNRILCLKELVKFKTSIFKPLYCTCNWWNLYYFTDHFVRGQKNSDQEIFFCLNFHSGFTFNKYKLDPFQPSVKMGQATQIKYLVSIWYATLDWNGLR